MNKTNTVVLLEADSDSMTDDWTDKLTVSRNARRQFTVKLSKFGEGPDGGNRRWRIWEKTSNLSTPTQLLDAIEGIVDDQYLSLDWAEATTSIAELDWIAAAIIAEKKNVQIPSIPTADELGSQHSLRALGKVTVGVEWGYQRHEVTLTMAQWIDIVCGDGHDMQTRYYYEGKRFTAYWSFSMTDQPYLEVTYCGAEDDDGTGWCGNLRSGHLFDTKSVHGVDVAKLMLRGASPEGAVPLEPLEIPSLPHAPTVASIGTFFPKDWLPVPATLEVSFVLSEGAGVDSSLYDEYDCKTIEDALLEVLKPRIPGILLRYSVVADPQTIPLLPYEVDRPLRGGIKSSPKKLPIGDCARMCDIYQHVRRRVGFGGEPAYYDRHTVRLRVGGISADDAERNWSAVAKGLKLLTGVIAFGRSAGEESV